MYWSTCTVEEELLFFYFVSSINLFAFIPNPLSYYSSNNIKTLQIITMDISVMFSFKVAFCPPDGGVAWLKFIFLPLQLFYFYVVKLFIVKGILRLLPNVPILLSFMCVTIVILHGCVCRGPWTKTPRQLAIRTPGGPPARWEGPASTS